MPNRPFLRTPSVLPHLAKCPVIPHHADLADLGVTSSALGPDLLRFGRILFQCRLSVNLLFARHFILLEIGLVVPFGSSGISGWPPDWSLLPGAAPSF
eukprot:359337-Chlamydomonas_euryale.AAC.1